MRSRIALALVALVFCGLAPPGLAGAAPGASDEPWGEALAAGGLRGETAQLTSARPTKAGRYRLPAFDPLWSDWRGLAPASERAADMALGARSLADLARAGRALLTSASQGWGAVHRRAPPLSWPRQGRAELAHAIAALHSGGLGPADRSALTQACAEVPERVAGAAARLLQAVPAGIEARSRALGKVRKAPAELFWPAIQLAQSGKRSPEADLLLERFDSQRLLIGAVPLAAAMDAVADRLAGSLELRRAVFDFSWETPLGWVVLSGAGDQHHTNRTYLLLVDTAGDDRYDAGGGNCNGDHPVSLLLDVAGDDRYRSVGSGDFGVGLLGYGFHLDLEGNDRYFGQDIGQGCGVAGVGILSDRSGRDHYQARKHSQGAGTLGVGILADASGDDRYDCRDQSQGFGGVRGVGVLVDRDGDDRYVADDETITRPAAQTKAHNTSLSQGAGFGIRTHGWAGGLGLLADGAGDDRYSCGVFGQGTAYWYALGLLVDRKGDDRYRGVWYVQGSAAHYAAAALVDGSGNDRYEALLNQAQGAGHDYSLGVLFERSGDDVYRTAGSGAQGWGIWNGIGALADLAGDDSYHLKRAGLGAAGPARPQHSCYGVFRDRGGRDTFPPKNRAKPTSRWVRRTKHPTHLGLGAAGP